MVNCNLRFKVSNMPKQGFKTITVPEQVYLELEKLAKERFTSVPRIVEYLISKEAKEKESVVQ